MINHLRVYYFYAVYCLHRIYHALCQHTGKLFECIETVEIRCK